MAKKTILLLLSLLSLTLALLEHKQNGDHYTVNVPDDVDVAPAQSLYEDRANYHDGNSHDDHVDDNQVTDFSDTKPREDPQIWAVLVAGSNEYYNYRHQADVCHAYQILRRNGIAKENIIVMMYDDIAYNEENPTPGIIINRPNGTDVYKGVIKDYTGKDVTPQNFMKVLLGDSEGMKGIGSEKVLKSGPNDHVFINFVDHGAPGLIGFPNDEMYAKDLEKTLKQMHHDKKFGKLVFYLEACESGSMFKNLLPSHWNIFATTAANSDESSYACYMDEVRNTYLGDVYSVMWMENADQVDLQSESLQSQFLVVRNETNTSHVQEFGDIRLRPLPVADFLGVSQSRIVHPQLELNPVESVDVPRVLLERKLSLAESLEERKIIKNKLNRLHKMRKLVSNQVIDIISAVTEGDVQERNILLRSRYELTNYNCYEASAKYFSKNCLSIAKNRYVTRKLYILVNMCERGWSTEAIIEAMANTCHQSFLTGIH